MIVQALGSPLIIPHTYSYLIKTCSLHIRQLFKKTRLYLSEEVMDACLVKQVKPFLGLKKMAIFMSGILLKEIL